MPAIGSGVPQALLSQSHQQRSVGADPLKSDTRTAAVSHLGSPWKLCRQPRPWPGPASTWRRPQSPQLLRPDLSQPRENPPSTLMTHRHWVYKGSGSGINPCIVQPQGEISVLLPKLCNPWGWALISAPPLCVGNPLACMLPELTEVALCHLSEHGEKGCYGGPCHSLHAPLNGASLLWWAWASLCTSQVVAIPYSSPFRLCPHSQPQVSP